MSLALRPYQIEARDEVIARYRAGARAVLLVMPCGSGKTVSAVDLIERATTKGNRTLFVANRRVLIDQTSRHLDAAGLRDHGVLMAGHWRRRPRCPVQVASIQTMLRRKHFPPADLVIIDECLSGDSIIETETGQVPLRHIRPGTRVVCYTGSACTTRTVRRFLPRGLRQTLIVKMASGRLLRCTKSHLLLTRRGWVRANDLVAGDEVCALADAACVPLKTHGLDRSRTSTATGDLAEREPSGPASMTASLPLSHPVRADAESGSGLSSGTASTLLSAGAGLGICAVTSRVTTSARQSGDSSSQPMSDLRFLERSSETPAFFFRTGRAQTPGCRTTTGRSSGRGLCTRRSSCGGSGHSSESTRTAATENGRSPSKRDACRASPLLCRSSSRTASSASRKSGWMALAQSASPGGSETTALAAQGAASLSTRRGTQKRTSGLLPLGLRGATAPLPSRRPADTLSSISSQTAEVASSRRQANTCRRAWTTNFDPVVSLSQGKCEEVFDLEIDEHHNFFANGLLAHNCHCARSRSYEDLKAAYPSARILGLSATPFRADGRSLGAFFDDFVVGAGIQELIDGGFLVQPHVYAPTMPDLRKVKIDKKSRDYQPGQLERAMDKPGLTGDIVKHWFSLAAGKRTAVFASGVMHSQHLVERFLAAGVPAAHIDASTPSGERERILARLVTAETLVVSSVGVLSEGWDCPACEVGVLARPTQSRALYLQQGGRLLRPCDGKSEALILDHAGNTLRHGFLTDEFDINFREDIEPPGTSESSPRARKCPKCMAVLPLSAADCPRCGYIFATSQAELPFESDATLVELQKAKPKPPFLEQQAYWRSLLVRGNLHASTTRSLVGWASARFVERFGFKPTVVDSEIVDPLRLTEEQGRTLWESLERVRVERGFRPGWSLWQWKNKTGRWPTKEMREAVA